MLAQLGSTWCHDCRDDQERRYEVIGSLKRTWTEALKLENPPLRLAA